MRKVTVRADPRSNSVEVYVCRRSRSNLAVVVVGTLGVVGKGLIFKVVGGESSWRQAAGAGAGAATASATTAAAGVGVVLALLWVGVVRHFRTKTCPKKDRGRGIESDQSPEKLVKSSAEGTPKITKVTEYMR